MNMLPRSPTFPRWITLGGSRLWQGNLSPDVARYLQSFRQPWAWFITAAVAALLMGITTGPAGFALAAALCGLTLAGGVWPWLAVRGIRCSVGFDRVTMTEGEAVQLRFRVENRWPIPVWGLMFSSGMELAADADAPAKDSSVALQMVGGWRTVEFVWDYRPGLRGVYPLASPAVSTGFPFAFWFAKRAVHVDRELLVWPGSMALGDVPLPHGWLNAIHGAEGKNPGQEADVTGLRPFRHGDSIRQVHWPQTARQSSLIVRERPGNCQPRFRIVVDLDPAVHRGRGPDATQEQTLRAASTLVRRLHQSQAQLQIQLGGPAAQIWENRQGLRPILNAMARWSSTILTAESPVWAPHLPAERILIVTTRHRAEQSACFPREADVLIVAGDGDAPANHASPMPRTHTNSADFPKRWAHVPDSFPSLDVGYEPLAI